MAYFLGIDIGTSSAKLIAVDEAGNVVKRCGRDYQYSQPGPGWKEIRPDVWVDAVEDGLLELLSELDKAQVRSIGFTGQMHTTVFLDHEGKCIRPAIMWNDMRTKDIIPSMKERIAGKEDTGQILRILSTGSPAANLLWLREHEYENFRKLGHFLIGPDYLVYYFSGAYSTDYCEASTSSLYDTEGRCWSETMRSLISLPDSVYPPVHGSREIVGNLSVRLQEKFGLPSDVRIIAGTGDNPAAAVATGALQYQYPVLSIGTSGVLVLSRNQVEQDVRGKQILFSMDGKKISVLVQGVVQSAGGSYNWYAKNILGVDDFDSLTAPVDMDTLGETDLLFYPHLTGDKTIYADPTLRGAFIGLDTNHTRVDLAVAVMEGICFAVRQLVQEMRLTKEELGQIRVTGGGSHSSVWMQILADVLDVEIKQLDGGEGASMGAAVMARDAVMGETGRLDHERADGELTGHQPAQACKPVKIRGYFFPRPYQVGVYDIKYKKYLKIYDAIKMMNQ